MTHMKLHSVLRVLAGALLPAAVLAACDSPTEPRQTEPIVLSVSVQGAPATLTVGQTVNLNARVVATDGTVLNRLVIWTSSDTTIATVSAAGALVARSAGTVEVRAATGGRSGSAQIEIANGAPSATQLLPAGALSGSAAFELTVVGAGFAPGATVLWNGSARPTRVVSATELRADIGADDLEDAGLASVVVVNPSTNDAAVSDRLYFTIEQRPAEAAGRTYRLMGLEGGQALPVEVSRNRWLDGAGVAQAAIQRAVAGTLRTTYDSVATRWHLVVTIATYLESTGEEVGRGDYHWWGTLMYDMWTGMPVLNHENITGALRTNALSETELVVYQVLHTNGEPENEKPWLYVRQ